jgi:hypothetical protein
MSKALQIRKRQLAVVYVHRAKFDTARERWHGFPWIQ